MSFENIIGNKKIKSELLDMLHKNREDYEKFFTTFGTTLKFGVYNDFGLNKDNLKDLLIFQALIDVSFKYVI